MRIQPDPAIHLTYCLNVHPGETWQENFQAVRDKAQAVRDRLGVTEPFGLGLRLSAAAAEELRGAQTLDDFRRFLNDRGLYVFTINGFPYGRFHGQAVKQDVYAPDWRDPRRRDYTIALANILAALLPEGVPGSISTVPGSYRAWITSEDDVSAMAQNLAEAAGHMEDLARRTGRDICLSLEPEPDCFVETTPQAVEFLTGPLLRVGRDQVAERLGLSADEADEVLRRRVGLCLDAAHAAVEFEDPAASLRTALDAGVRVGKVQLSAALRTVPSDQTLKRLKDFCDEAYLHQVKARAADGRITSWADLPDALRATRASGQAGGEWRIHFHVPLFFRSAGGLASTSADLTGEFAALLRGGACPNLEIETYTFAVLPDYLRAPDVADSIAQEYRWVLRDMFHRAHSSGGAQPG